MSNSNVEAIKALQELGGVGPKKAEKLVSAGKKTFEDVANTSKEDLHKILKPISEDQLDEIIAEAKEKSDIERLNEFEAERHKVTCSETISKTVSASDNNHSTTRWIVIVTASIVFTAVLIGFLTNKGVQKDILQSITSVIVSDEGQNPYVRTDPKLASDVEAIKGSVTASSVLLSDDRDRLGVVEGRLQEVQDDTAYLVQSDRRRSLPVADLNKKLGELQTEQSDLSVEVSVLTDDVEAIKGSVTASSVLLSDVRDRLGVVEGRLQEVQDDTAYLVQSDRRRSLPVADLNKKLGELQTEQSDLSVEVSVLTDTLSSAHSAGMRIANVTEVSDKIDAKRARLAEIDQEILAIKAEIEKRQACQAGFGQLGQRIDGIERRFDSVDNRLEGLRVRQDEIYKSCQDARSTSATSGNTVTGVGVSSAPTNGASAPIDPNAPAVSLDGQPYGPVDPSANVSVGSDGGAFGQFLEARRSGGDLGPVKLDRDVQIFHKQTGDSKMLYAPMVVVRGGRPFYFIPDSSQYWSPDENVLGVRYVPTR